MRVIYFLLLLFISGACSKEAPVNTLIGTWQLTNYCKAASGSACMPVTVPTQKNVFISFTNDGKFNETYNNTKPVEYSFLGCGGGSYQIEGNNVRIVAACMSSLSGRVMPFQLANPDQLMLNPFGGGDYVFARVR